MCCGASLTECLIPLSDSAVRSLLKFELKSTHTQHLNEEYYEELVVSSYEELQLVVQQFFFKHNT